MLHYAIFYSFKQCYVFQAKFKFKNVILCIVYYSHFVNQTPVSDLLPQSPNRCLREQYCHHFIDFIVII